MYFQTTDLGKTLSLSTQTKVEEVECKGVHIFKSWDWTSVSLSALRAGKYMGVFSDHRSE